MSTVDKDFVDKIIAANGQLFEGDPPIVKIVKHNNCYNDDDSYGIIYEGQNLDRYAESFYVRNPVTYWEKPA